MAALGAGEGGTRGPGADGRRCGHYGLLVSGRTTAGWHSSTKNQELMRPFPTRPIGLLSSLCLPAALTTLSDLLDRLNSFGNFDFFIHTEMYISRPVRPTAPFCPKCPYWSPWLNDRRTGRETRGKWRWGGARRDWALVAGVIGRTPEAGHAYLTSLAVYRLF